MASRYTNDAGPFRNEPADALAERRHGHVTTVLKQRVRIVWCDAAECRRHRPSGVGDAGD